MGGFMNRFQILRMNKGFFGRGRLKILDWVDRIRRPKKKSNSLTKESISYGLEYFIQQAHVHNSSIYLLYRAILNSSVSNVRRNFLQAISGWGLMGVGDDGTLYKPDGDRIFRVPMFLARRIQWNQHQISRTHTVLLFYAEEIWEGIRTFSLILFLSIVLTISLYVVGSLIMREKLMTNYYWITGCVLGIVFLFSNRMKNYYAETHRIFNETLERVYDSMRQPDATITMIERNKAIHRP